MLVVSDTTMQAKYSYRTDGSGSVPLSPASLRRARHCIRAMWVVVMRLEVNEMLLA